MDREIMNKNGDVVDVAALGTSNDPFGQELRNRTAGLETDDELMETSLLSLKRKEGRVWVYCRRYKPKWTSFLSTKEVSSYLHSVFGTQDTQPNPYSSVETGVGKNLATGRIANLLHKDVETKEDFTRHQASIQAPIFTEQENTATPFRDESLPLVEANDYLVCHKCNTSYADKDAYLQHLLTSHQSKNKSRLCTSISDGVIIKDGKYECQFCHKIFLEKHRYNGHVGVTPSVIFKGNEMLDTTGILYLRLLGILKKR
ncbi:hypothetical protein C5167_017546 [Papaver somniferum]|uniref:C2H2-type domain-containing protein n=1 Tax=Papaver somniferum TaxID=3469 RepID=A0A4Y7IMU5_PAPSO|nr:hypothetical protein C5167_017546 [Papaver somniferum]